MDTYYEILGLSRKPTKDDLAMAYLRLACENHPDHADNSSDRTERFRLVGEAFSVLYETKMRFRYDKHLASDSGNELGRRVPVSLEHALALFREMTGKYIEADLGDDDDPNRVLEDLVGMKCPAELAEKCVAERAVQLRAEIRAAGLKTLGLALLVFVPGAGLTLYSYVSSRSGSYLLWYGPIIVGSFFLLYALHCLAAGIRPAFGNPLHYFLGTDEERTERRKR